MWMNRYEVEEAREWFRHDAELALATETLCNLVEWTDSNSDGWPYWNPPAKAAGKLCEILYRAMHYEERPTPAQLAAALRPIKAFRTRRGADFLTGEEAQEAREAAVRERAANPPMVDHVRRAVVVLTEHELSPSTRDLLALEGCAVADWCDREEKLDLIDAILSEYEAQAVAYVAPGERESVAAVRAIVAARVSVQEAKRGGVAA